MYWSKREALVITCYYIFNKLSLSRSHSRSLPSLSPPPPCLPLPQEYKVSSFEQRLISEIEFRLERSPVEESDEDVQHDEDAEGPGAAPSFAHKLKHLKVFEGMPVTFTCKVHGDPKPKVGGLARKTRLSPTRASWVGGIV